MVKKGVKKRSDKPEKKIRFPVLSRKTALIGFSLAAIITLAVQVFAVIKKAGPVYYFIAAVICFFAIGKVFDIIKSGGSRKKNAGTEKKKKIPVKIRKKPVKSAGKKDRFFLFALISFIVILLSVAASYLFFINNKSESFHIPWFIQALVFLNALAMAAVTAVFRKTSFFEGESGKYDRYDIFICLFFLAFVLITRFYRLGELPAGTNIDETNYTDIAAYALSEVYKWAPFAGSGNGQFGGLAHDVIAFFFKHFGISLFSLRLLPALCAVPLVIFFYLFLRLFFEKPIAALAALILAADHNFIHTTRWMHIPTVGAWLYWAVLFCSVYAVRFNRGLFVSLAGALTGLALYLYSTNKVLPVLVCAFIFYEVVRNIKGKNTASLKNNALVFLTWGVTAVIALLPLINFIAHNSAQYFGYFSTQKANLAYVLWNLPAQLGMFTFRGTRYALQNYPLFPVFDIIPAVFFITGLALALFYPLKRLHFIALVSFIIGILPAVFSKFWLPPNHQRAIIAILAGYIFIGIGLAFFYRIFTAGKNRILKIILAGLVVISSVNEVYTYFYRMQNNNEFKMQFSPIEYSIGKVFNGNYKDKDIYFSRFFFGGKGGTHHFMGSQIYFARDKLKDFSLGDRVLGASNHNKDSLLLFKYRGRDIMLVLEPFYFSSEEFLRTRFPGVSAEKRPATIHMNKFWARFATMWILMPDDYNPDYEMVMYTIPKEDIEAVSGGVFYKETGGIVKKNILLDGNGESINQKGRLKGRLKIFKEGEYRFKLEKNTAALFYVDSQKYKAEEPLSLFDGIHDIEIKVDSLSAGEVFLIKHPDSDKYVPVPEGDFFNDGKIDAVKTKIFYADDGTPKELLREEKTPDFSFKWRYFCAKINWSRHARVECSSYLNIKTPGEYEFEVRGRQDAFVSVAGKDVYKFIWKGQGPHDIAQKKIFLNKGRHKIKVVYDKPHKGWWSELFIKEPGAGDFRLVNEDDLARAGK